MSMNTLSHPRILCHLGGTALGVIPEPAIEPGHQWIAVENTRTGRALAFILGGGDTVQVGDCIILAHNLAADRMLTDLLTACQEINRVAPGLAQRALFVAGGEITEDPRD